MLLPSSFALGYPGIYVEDRRESPDLCDGGMLQRMQPVSGYDLAPGINFRVCGFPGAGSTQL